MQLFALIYIQLSLKHIYQTGHSITSVTLRGICDGDIVVTSVCVTVVMLSQVS